MKRLLASAACLSWLVMALPAQAAERATLILHSGERITGELNDMNASGFHMIVNGEDRRIETERVAVIEFAEGSAPPDIQAKINSGQPLAVLRNGQIVEGRLTDVGGTSPLRLTFGTGSSSRNVTSNEVARIYLPGASESQAVATSGIGSTNTLTVPANQQWTSTNVQVNAGERLNLSVSGAVRFSPNDADWSQAAGARGQKMGPNAPLQTAPKGALLGRIDNGQPFHIGDQRAVRMPATGTLYLGVNDDLVSDNEGSFQVTIAKERR